MKSIRSQEAKHREKCQREVNITFRECLSATSALVVDLLLLLVKYFYWELFQVCAVLRIVRGKKQSFKIYNLFLSSIEGKTVLFLHDILLNFCKILGKIVICGSFYTRNFER
jgi:hypothetical protein